MPLSTLISLSAAGRASLHSCKSLALIPERCKSLETPMTELSPIANAIRHYKLNADGGYEEWSKVPCTPAYRMHVPSQGFDVQGAAEVEEVIFGWLSKQGAKQTLLDIVELGENVTCFLKIENADGTEISMTEVFQIVDGAVNEIWAL